MDPSSQILTVSELTFSVKQKLENNFSFVAVRGEVSNLRKQASGHVYFTLKDRDAQLSSVLFRGNASRLSRLPKEGDQLIAKGQLSVYAPRGSYQLIVREVEYSGTGPLLQKLHETKEKLKAKGWFEADKKKPLPKFPKTIGVVTSPTGSVIQDILHILTRRFSGFQLLLNPVRVQGEGAAAEIAQAVRDFDKHGLADVIIVGRGGGSLEDLWPFNEELVAEAIFHAKTPIISAVGHETDFTLADFVADVRAPTPSAAAEIVTEEKNAHLSHLAESKVRALQSLASHLRSSRQNLEMLTKQPPLSDPYSILGTYGQKLDLIREDLTRGVRQAITKGRLRLEGSARQKEALKPSAQIATLKQNFARQQKELTRSAFEHIAHRSQRLRLLKSHLEAIDPRNVLKRGYSIAFHEKKDSVILSTSDVEAGDNIRLRVSDGELLVTAQGKQ